MGDRVDAEIWYNETRFEGDTLKSGKARQILTLPTVLYSPSGTDGFAITDAEGSSMGARWETTFGRPDQVQSSFGVDVTHVRQALNDIEPLLDIDFPGDYNFPIPPSHSTDIGLYWEEIAPISDSLTITGGARIDLVLTDAANNVPGQPITVKENLDTNTLDRDFVLLSGFLTAEQQLNNQWSATVGAGYGERPPTLTELYTNASFIGSLQRGLTSLIGDPKLNEERLTKIDFLAFRGITIRFDSEHTVTFPGLAT
jgi:iron complex outermembrane receptor protein